MPDPISTRDWTTPSRSAPSAALVLLITTGPTVSDRGRVQDGGFFLVERHDLVSGGISNHTDPKESSDD